MEYIADRLQTGDTIKYTAIEDTDLLKEILKERNVDLVNQTYFNEAGEFVVTDNIDEAFSREGQGELETQISPTVDPNDMAYDAFVEGHPNHEVYMMLVQHNIDQIGIDLDPNLEITDAVRMDMDAKTRQLGRVFEDYENLIYEEVSSQFPFLSEPEQTEVALARIDNFHDQFRGYHDLYTDLNTPDFLKEFKCDELCENGDFSSFQLTQTNETPDNQDDKDFSFAESIKKFEWNI